MRAKFESCFLFTELCRPETVTALIIDGVRYEAADTHTPAD